MPVASRVYAIGLMSGTSMDGVDAALIESDGIDVTRTGPALTLPYDAGFRARLRAVLGENADPAALADVARELTDRHDAAVRALLTHARLGADQIAVIGFHGHTVLHRPDQRRSVQIGDGERLAALTGCRVVSDFRAADTAAGGQGAPLVPLYHLARAGGLDRPLAILNLGGVGNVTWLGVDDALLAFDTGPGNALIDDWVLRHTGVPCDADGKLARRGRVHAGWIERLRAMSFFDQPPPKSLDRDEFRLLMPDGLGLEDGAATLAALTVEAVVLAQRHFPAPAKRWLVTGGGRLNPMLMDGLARSFGVPVEPVEAIGWDGNALEAEAFAYLALRALDGLPLSLPSTTGVPYPMPGGRIADPAARPGGSLARLAAG